MESCNSVHVDIPLIANGSNAQAELMHSHVLSFLGSTKEVGQYLMLLPIFQTFLPPIQNDREILQNLGGG